MSLKSKILIKEDQEIEFSEYPGDADTGIIDGIFVESNEVVVWVQTQYTEELIEFELDGSPWSMCGRFKRDIPFVE